MYSLEFDVEVGYQEREIRKEGGIRKGVKARKGVKICYIT